MKNKKHKRDLLLIFFIIDYIVIICLIIYLSLFKEIEFMSKDGSDKLGHFLAYFSLSFINNIILLLRKMLNIYILIFFALNLIMSIVIEYIQKFVGRSFDIEDIYANMIGILLGLLISFLLSRFLNLKRGINEGK